MSHHTRMLGGRHSRLGTVTGLAALAAAVSLAALAGGPPALAAPARAASPSVTGNHDHRLPATAGRAGLDSESGVTGGALFGGNYPLVKLESQIGRKLAVVRLYLHIGNSFPGPYRSLLAGGRTVIVSLDSLGPSYASIAAGDEDAVISKFLQQVNNSAIKYHLPAIYFTFEHEPDAHLARTLGTPAQFVQAWDHVHQLAVSMHLDWNDGGRIHWVLILIHNTYAGPRAAQFWPGLGEVDIIASDGYNSAGCRARKSGGKTVHNATPQSLFNPVLSFASSHGGLPVFITEFGSDILPPSAQSQFISEMQTYVTDHLQIYAALYWNSGRGPCTYKVNNEPASISALATMGAAPALQGHTTGS